MQRETGPSTHLFMSERKAPISTDGFQKLVERLSARQVTSGGRKECRNPRKEKGLSRYRAPVSQNASPQSGVVFPQKAGRVMTQLLLQDSSPWLVENWLTYDWPVYVAFLLALLTLAGIVVAAAIATSWHD